MKLNLKSKKVLLMGLGILGGGTNTAKWLVEQGVILTITDLKNAKQLAPSLKQLETKRKKIKFVLGRHKDKDFLENEIIVVNPDVPFSSPYLSLAKKAGKRIENELSLFWKSIESKNIIAITGTRGKTTTANWIYHFIKAKYPKAVIAGNSPDKALFDAIKNVRKGSPVVIEAPSFLLEHTGEFKPKVAVITNIYPDHLNRYKNIQHYALTKANIFKYQDENDFLILNQNNKWSRFLKKQKPNLQVINFSKEPQVKFDKKKFIKKWGEHNLENLSAAILASKVFGIPDKIIYRRIDSLPQIKFRQELVFKSKNLEIYNDTAATSPEATIAAIRRFKDKDVVLITGGTDKNLEFKDLAKAINKYLGRENTIFLVGSATNKLRKELRWDKANEFENLKKCVQSAISTAKHKNFARIVFSPGAKSFEKFKNEFDRGRQFNNLIKKIKWKYQYK